MSYIDAIAQHPDVTKPPNGKGDFKAWCPDHPDKRPGGKPSLRGNTKKGVTNCMRCGGHTLKHLAEAWGIPIEPKEDGRRRKAPPAEWTAEHAMIELKAIYLLRDSTIGHFKIEAKPNAKASDRRKTGAWRYPTRAGWRFKAFDRDSKNGIKFWWATNRGDDKPAPSAVLYGVEDLPDGIEEVWLTNGDASRWVCWQADVPAVSHFAGEGGLNTEAAVQLVEREVRWVNFAPDLDGTGADTAHRTLEILREVGLEVRCFRLPSHLEDKADLADLYTWGQGDDEKFRDALAKLKQYDPPDPKPLTGTPFEVKGNALFQRVASKDGDGGTHLMQLTNFVASIDEEVLLDDGLETRIEVAISGKMASGVPLPKRRIPAETFHAMNWVAKEWGTRPLIVRGAGTKDTVREIIQRLSIGAGYDQRTVFTHTGFREVNGEWRYLWPSSKPGEELDVDLRTKNLRHYKMPPHPEDLPDAIRASLRILDVAPRMITLPLFAYAYLAPLATMISPGFTLYLVGQSGSQKSALGGLATAHFGDFSYKNPPASWDASPGGLERYLYTLKDGLAWVDDFKPRSDKDRQMMGTRFDLVTRALANQIPRLRMDRTTQSRDALMPQSLLVSTGEEMPHLDDDSSMVARMITLELHQGLVDLEKVKASDRERARFPHAMRGYTDYVTANRERLIAEYSRTGERYQVFEEDTPPERHGRHHDAIVMLKIGLAIFGEYAVHVGGVTADEADSLLAQASLLFEALGRQQTQRMDSADPLERYFAVIDSMLHQGKAIFWPRGRDGDPPFGKALLGRYDDTLVHFDPVASYQAPAAWLRQSGQSLPFGENDLAVLFDRAGLLAKRDGKHLASKVRVNGTRPRMISVKREAVPFSTLFTEQALVTGDED